MTNNIPELPFHCIHIVDSKKESTGIIMGKAFSRRSRNKRQIKFRGYSIYKLHPEDLGSYHHLEISSSVGQGTKIVIKWYI